MIAFSLLTPPPPSLQTRPPPPPASPSTPSKRLSSPPPVDDFPVETAASANRRSFASQVYDLFIKDGHPAVLTSDLNRLLEHLALQPSQDTTTILALLDPTETGYVAKDLFLGWYDKEDANMRMRQGKESPRIAGEKRDQVKGI